MSQPIIVGSVPWEQLIAQASKPVPERPPGSFTFAEWRERTGKGEDTAYEMLHRLITAGAVRPMESRIILRGVNRRTILYVPCAPPSSQSTT